MTTVLHASPYTWAQFSPVFYLIGLAVLILLADTFLPRLPKQLFPPVGALGAFVTGCFMISGTHTNMFGQLVCGGTALCLLMLWDYRSVAYASVAGGDDTEGSTELTPLLLIACAGVCALTLSRDLVMLFVSLETLTLSSYAMTGYFRRNQGSIEAGVKYLILGAVSTGMLVMGAAWYYGTTGTFSLENPQPVLNALLRPELCTGFLVGIAMLLVAAFFKIGAAPMHTWIPDVYQGAPTPVSAMLAVVSKIAGFVVLILLIYPESPLAVTSQFQELVHPISAALAAVAALTLLVGNLGAIRQQNAKRLLGYSSIGQAGFILVLFISLRQPRMGYEVWFYLLSYGLATIAAFWAIAQLRMQRGHEQIDAFRGLGKTNPRTAFLITVAFASLAGVPLTGGFLAKLYSFRALWYARDAAAIEGCCLLPVMIVCAAAGFYYYFKVLRAMYWERPQDTDKPVAFSPLALGMLTLSALMLVVMGTTPLIIK